MSNIRNMSEINAGGTVENPNENGDVSFDRNALLEKSPEELADLVMKASAGTINAKKKLEELKKAPEFKAKTDVTTDVLSFDEDAFERKYEEKKFFESNPEMLEYKEQIASYVQKGIPYNKAKALVELDDPSIANRKVAQTTNISSGDIGVGIKTYSGEELYELGQKDPALKRKAMEDIANGKAREVA